MGSGVVTRAAVAAAIRQAGGDFNKPGAVARFDELMDLLGIAPDEAADKALRNPAALFGNLRKSGLFVGGLDQGQVDGINIICSACGEAGWGVSWTAYALATAYWETNKTMQPVEEAYYLGAKAEAHRKTLRYYPWHGRGYPQLTWEKNYRWADSELGLNGALLKDPSLMLTPEVAAPTMVRGMEQGAFTGKGLRDYLPAHGPATFEQFKQARRIINGTDRAAEIANIALRFQAALVAGDWS